MPPTAEAVQDVNAVIGGFLRDLALETPLSDLVKPDRTLERISGIGPASARVIHE